MRLLWMVLVAALLAPATASGAGWAPATAQPETSGYGLLVLPDGEAFLQSQAQPHLPEHDGLYLSHRAPGAADFGAPERVVHSDAWVPSRLEEDGAGGVRLVWSGAAGAHLRERPRGGSWREVPGSFGPAEPLPQVGTGPDGGTVVVWREGTELRARQRPPGGSFGDVEVVAGDLPPVGTNPASHPRVVVTATEDGDTVVVWTERTWVPAVGEPGDPGYEPAKSVGSLRLVAGSPGAGWEAPMVLAERSAIHNEEDYPTDTEAGYGGVDVAPRRGGGWTVAAREYVLRETEDGGSYDFSGVDAIKVLEGTGSSAATVRTYDERNFTRDSGMSAGLFAIVTDAGGGATIQWQRRNRYTNTGPVFAVHRAPGGALPDAPTAEVVVEGDLVTAPLGGDRQYWLNQAGDGLRGAALPAGPLSGPLPEVRLEGPIGPRLAELTGDGAGHVLLRTSSFGPDERFPLQVYDEVAPALSDIAVPVTADSGSPVRMTAAVRDLWTAGSVRWDFGDGATAEGTEVDHAYAAAGRYTVTVTGVDAAGNRVSEERTIEVPPGPPAGGGQPVKPVEPPPIIVEPVDRSAPGLTGARVSGRRATVRFVLSEAGTVDLRLYRERAGVRRGGKCRTSRAAKRRGGKPCRRLVRLAKAEFAAGAGAVQRRLVERRLGPGRYRVRVRVRDAAGNVAKPAAIKLRVAP